MHVVSDALIGIAYLGISVVLYLLVRSIRLPFSPVFVAFGLFIGLCGITHFMSIWTIWQPDYLLDGLLKMATAAASVATAIGLSHVGPRSWKWCRPRAFPRNGGCSSKPPTPNWRAFTAR
jgi:hypothetical protein